MLNCNYYNEIKNELINNEIYKRVKDYSKNRNELSVYYNVGKLLSEAGKHYGEGIIKEYSRKLTIEIGSGYGISNLKRMRQFYLIVEKGVALPHQLSWSHILAILPINNINEINYYISISIEQNLSYRQLREKIKSKEYQRLDDKTKLKLINKEETVVSDFIKNPIIIRNKYNVDLLLFNYTYNCFVVIELKVTELKKEHIGQIEVYMNYVDKNIKTINQDKTIGVIICKKDNGYYIEYSSDSRIYHKEYILN